MAQYARNINTNELYQVEPMKNTYFTAKYGLDTPSVAPEMGYDLLSLELKHYWVSENAFDVFYESIPYIALAQFNVFEPVGPPGPQGPKGDVGPMGPMGPMGPQGVQGEPGPQGIKGEKGDKGDKGDTGPQGLQGLQGIQGPVGPQGTPGSSVTIQGSYDTYEQLVEAHPTDIPGNAYLVPPYLYVWSNTDYAWKNVGNIQGPTGPAGPQGAPGPTGASGVYVGEETPTDPTVNVWIYPDDNPTSIANASQVEMTDGTDVESNIVRLSGETKSLNDAFAMMVDDLEELEAKEDAKQTIIVSPTTPTAGENVWIQKSANMFDKNSFILFDRTLNSAGGYDGIASHFVQDCYIEVEPNKTYVFAIDWNILPTNYSQGRIAVSEFANDYTFIQRLINREGTYIRFTTTETTRYVKVCAPRDALDSAQLVEGTEVPAYTPYSRKVFVKDSNNKYVLINSDRDLLHWSQGEQMIGYFQDGKPYYRRVVNFGLVGSNSTNQAFELIDDFQYVTVANLFIYNPNGQTSTLPIWQRADHYFTADAYTVPEDRKVIVETFRANVYSWSDWYVWGTLEYTKRSEFIAG